MDSFIKIIRIYQKVGLSQRIDCLPACKRKNWAATAFFWLADWGRCWTSASSRKCSLVSDCYWTRLGNGAIQWQVSVSPVRSKI